MALTITTETNFGEERELYVRVNNIDQLTNHDEAGPDLVRFRGFISKEAFEQRKHFMWELVIECPIDVTQPVWPQAYAAIKAHDPTLAVEEPHDPRTGLPPLGDGAKPDLRKAWAQAETEWASAKERFDTDMAVAERVRASLAAAKDC